MADFDEDSLPISDSGSHGDGEEESLPPGLGTYCVRITPYEQFTYEQLEKHVIQQLQPRSWVIGTEISAKGILHYHLVFESDDEDPKGFIRAFIDEVWPKEERTRGFGNKQYNFQVAKDPVKAVTYAVKCGKYKFGGFYDEEFIQACKADSFVPSRKSEFKQKLDELKKLFHENKSLDQWDFMREFILLKAQYDQMVNMDHAYGYAISILIKREPQKVHNLIADFKNKKRETR